MPYISNKRPKPKPPQNNVMTISKALKAVNDNMDWTVLFIALLLVMGCSLPLLGGTGACYRYIFTNIAKIQRLFHWSYDAYISTMLHIRMDNFQ